jgi:hypothetical protein
VVAVHLARQPGVSVVEPDHPIALFDQLGAEPVRPHRQLSTDTHDQQDRRVGGIAEILVEDLDTVTAQRCPASNLHTALTLRG